MPKIIKNDELKEYGILTHHEKMDNGELRFRMLSEDGSSYVRGENRDSFVWGNSHFHKELSEVMFLQRGMAIFVEYTEEGLIYRKLNPGDFFITRIGIAHNQCFIQDTVIHTIKYGGNASEDWYACPTLDKLTKHLTLEQMLEFV